MHNHMLCVKIISEINSIYWINDHLLLAHCYISSQWICRIMSVVSFACGVKLGLWQRVVSPSLLRFKFCSLFCLTTDIVPSLSRDTLISNPGCCSFSVWTCASLAAWVGKCPYRGSFQLRFQQLFCWNSGLNLWLILAVLNLEPCALQHH